MTDSAIGRSTATTVGTDGTWTWRGHHGEEIHGALTRDRFARFQELLAGADLGVETTCEPIETPAHQRQTVSLSDYARDRFVTYVQPCMKPSPRTQRALECLTSVMFASPERYEYDCRLPPGE